MSKETINITGAGESANELARLKAELELFKVRAFDAEEKLVRLTNTSQEGIILIDDNFKILFVNNELCRIMGHEEAELLGSDFRNLIDVTSKGKVSDYYTKRQSGEDVVNRYEFCAVCKSGEKKLIRASAKSFQERNGKQQTVAYLLDITDKKKAEEILEHRVKFEELIAAISTIFINFPGKRLDELINYAIKKIADFNQFDRGYIYMFSHQHVMLDLTHEWCRQLQCEKLRENSSVMAYSFPWIVEKLKRQENIYIKDIVTLPAEAVEERKFYKSRNVKSVLIVPLVYDQSLAGLLGFESFRDYNDCYPEDIRLMNMVAEIIINAYKRKWSEKALSDSEERFRGIFENANLGIYRYTPNHTLEMANEALIKMLGYDSFDELSLIDLKREVFVDLQERNRFESLLRKTESLYGQETQWKNVNGSIIEMSENARAVKDDKGRVLYYEGFVENITVRKKTRIALLKAKEAAEKSDRMKTDFLQQMSHEIRTPITAILNNANMLRFMLDENIDEMMGQQFNSITQGGMRIIRTVDLIINMSELQSGNYKPEFTEFDLVKKAINKQYENFKKLAHDKNLIFEIKANLSLGITKGDLYSTNQIFEQVIDNAIKFTESGSVIIYLEEGEEELTVIVKDTGVGISSEYLPKIYEPFSQEEEGSNRRFEGNGLGLALVKEYCKINSFTISITSTKGEGTEVKITLPITHNLEIHNS